MKEEIDVRKIKIQPMYIMARWTDTKITSRLLLCGDWLKNAGFKPGDRVKIIVLNDLLVVMKDDNQNSDENTKILNQKYWHTHL